MNRAREAGWKNLLKNGENVSTLVIFLFRIICIKMTIFLWVVAVGALLWDNSACDTPCHVKLLTVSKYTFTW